MLQSIFKTFRDAPASAVAMALVLAVLGLWQDAKRENELNRAYMKEQNALQVQCIKEQTAAFVMVSERLQHIEATIEIMKRNQKTQPEQ
jgi:hypothetical protein